jgi:hypothetical protein
MPIRLPTSKKWRWVCNPWGRCWRRPNYYGAHGFYPVPRFGHRHWGIALGVIAAGADGGFGSPLLFGKTGAPPEKKCQTP